MAPPPTKFRILDPWGYPKRAAKACLSCRTRKIRCDVDQTGPPCSHCRAERFSCEVLQRSRKRAGRTVKIPSSASTLRMVEPPPSPQCLLNAAASDAGTKCHGSVHDQALSNSLNFLDRSLADEENNPDFDKISEWVTQNGGLDLFSRTRDANLKDVVQAIHAHQHQLSNSLRNTHLMPELCQRSSASSTANPYVTSALNKSSKSANDSGRSSSSPSSPLRSQMFSQIPMSDRLCSSDMKFLEDNGCFQVPQKWILDVFLREYFLHIHPMLPVLYERDFCETFHDTDGDDIVPDHPSLFVIQAVLAASSVFVPLSTLSACGFQSYRAARQSLCRRACLLYDLEWEDDPITITQGALILSLISSNNNMAKGNSFWLMTAVRYAMASRPDPGRTQPAAIQDLWKRLWWCCIIRDRLISLGSRRPLHITLEMFNPLRLPALTLADFESDRDMSLVYDRTTQRQLAQYFLSQLQLAIALSKLLTLTYSSDGSVVPKIASLRDYSETLLRVEQCKDDLRRWSRSRLIRPSFKGLSHISLILFDRLLSMSFHTAEIALHSTEILLFHFYPSYVNALIESRLCVARENIYDSIMSICEATADLSARGLETKLDMQGPAYTALPFKVLEIGSQLDPESCESAILNRHLQTLQTAMKEYKCKWDGIDPVFNQVELLIPLPSTPPGHENITDMVATEAHRPADLVSSLSFKDTWCELFKQHLALYLQVTTTLNYCIARGNRVRPDDLPEQLRSDFFTPASVAIKATRSESEIYRIPQEVAVNDCPWADGHIIFLDPMLTQVSQVEKRHHTTNSTEEAGRQVDEDLNAFQESAVDAIISTPLQISDTMVLWDEFLEH